MLEQGKFVVLARLKLMFVFIMLSTFLSKSFAQDFSSCLKPIVRKLSNSGPFNLINCHKKVRFYKNSLAKTIVFWRKFPAPPLYQKYWENNFSLVRSRAPTEILLCFLKSWEQNWNPGACSGILAAITERPENFKVASYKWWAFVSRAFNRRPHSS